MKILKSIMSLALVMLFVSSLAFTSCGGKKEGNNAEQTEHPEGGEHPEGDEHPAGEHPIESDSSEKS